MGQVVCEELLEKRNTTKEVMIKEKDEIMSKFGYNKITVALGKNIAMKVSNLIRSF